MLTIIIPTINTTGDVAQDQKVNYSLDQCLTSLQETCDFPIVVVSNNGDPKPLPRVTDKRVKRINLWEQGQCKAVNAAVASVDTEYVMITNDDMVYPPGWHEKLLVNYEQETPDGIRHASMPDCFCPQLIEPRDGAPTFKKVFFGGAGGDFNKEGFLDYAKTHTGEWRTGFNMPMVIRRDLWNKVGGYDINYDPWGSNSDSDLQYKIMLSGVQPMQNANACVYHFSQTSGTFDPKHGKYYGENFAYFEKKWGFPRTDDRIWESDFEIPLKKLIFRPNYLRVTHCSVV